MIVWEKSLKKNNKYSQKDKQIIAALQKLYNSNLSLIWLKKLIKNVFREF